jgi:hypothetical protein
MTGPARAGPRHIGAWAAAAESVHQTSASNLMKRLGINQKRCLTSFEGVLGTDFRHRCPTLPVGTTRRCVSAPLDVAREQDGARPVVAACSE